MRLLENPYVLWAVVAGLLIWLVVKPEPQPVGVPMVAKPALQKVQKETISAKVSVYKPAAKKAVALPPEVKADPDKHVVAASRVVPDIHPHTVTTVLDSETGDVVTYDTKEPMPWLAPAYRGEAGIAYGIKNGVPMGRLFVRQSLIDVKRLTLGVEVTADQDGEVFAGVAVSYRW